jgi:hypothetical protein
LSVNSSRIWRCLRARAPMMASAHTYGCWSPWGSGHSIRATPCQATPPRRARQERDNLSTSPSRYRVRALLRCGFLGWAAPASQNEIAALNHAQSPWPAPIKRRILAVSMSRPPDGQTGAPMRTGSAYLVINHSPGGKTPASDIPIKSFVCLVKGRRPLTTESVAGNG